MPQKNDSLREGAGATTGSGTSTTGSTTASTTSGSTSGSSFGSTTSGSTTSGSTGGSSFETSGSRGFDYGSQYSSYDSGSRDVVLAERSRSQPSTATVIGAAIAGAIAGGAIPFMLGRSSSSGSRRESQVAEESVTINRSARELYDFWRDFTNFPQFMDNIESVTKLDDRRSHWVIKAPAGTTVEFDSRITEDVPGRLIAWQSEEGASVPNRGRVEFIEGSAGNTTTVRTWISFDPPAGAAGRLVAKLFQREPGTQARQDLTRFKQLMENGRVTG